MTQLCQHWGKEWVCSLREGHEGPCPAWPVHRPNRFMCRYFGHKFDLKYWSLAYCHRCGYPRVTE